LDIDAIAEITARPQNVIGTHFFSPAQRDEAPGERAQQHSSAQTIATAMSLGKLLAGGRAAGNCDGFIGNRMLQFIRVKRIPAGGGATRSRSTG